MIKYNHKIGLHINQYWRMIHLNIIQWQKNPVFLLGMFKTSLEYFLSTSPTVFNPKKTSLTPVGLVMQTKEIFLPLKKKKKNEWGERQNRKAKTGLF